MILMAAVRAKLNPTVSTVKKNELQADIIGAKRFVEDLDYANSELITSFLVMPFSNLPFDEVKFNKDFFEVNDFCIHEEMISDSTEEKLHICPESKVIENNGIFKIEDTIFLRGCIGNEYFSNHLLKDVRWSVTKNGTNVFENFNLSTSLFLKIGEITK